MSDNDPTRIRFSQGKKNFGKVKNKTLPWKLFKKEFALPFRTGETFRQYLKMSEKEQRDLKAVNGYWMRAQNKDEIRKRGNALPCDVMTLDVDYATQEMFEKARKGLLLPGIAHFIHTSRRHTPENPRFRIVILLLNELDNDYYAAASRICCAEIDPSKDKADPVSFRPAQMMFMPTVCKDGEYVFMAFDGDPFDWEAALEDYSAIHGDWKDISNLPKWEGEAQLRQTADKAEDPTTKEGPVGDFCRAYDVPSAIEVFLSDKYEPVDAPSAKPRYTYLGGTTVNGAEVQDDGLFLYSHHGSDPCSDMLVNAFDLVRIHKFGGQDKDFDAEDKSPGSFPSWKAMLEFIEKDEGFRKSRSESRYDTEAMFDDLWDEDKVEILQATEDQEIEDLVGTQEPSIGYADDDIEADYPDLEEIENPKSAKKDPVGIDNQKGHIGITSDGLPYLKEPRKRRPKPKDGWVSELLEFNPKTGEIKATVSNVVMILQHDTRIRDAIAYNEFEQKPVMIRPIRNNLQGVTNFTVDKHREIGGMPWLDVYDDVIRVLLEAENGTGKKGWGLKVTDRDLRAGVLQVSHGHLVHPVKEVLNSFTWDQTARVESLFHDYLGCEDNAYHREAARKWMIAAVARVFEPGHKFDFAPVLVGGQGIGKSTFAETLAMGWFGELTADFSEDQKLAEQMLNNWIMELPELVSMTRSAVETAKAFISQRTMTVRMAYDRNPTEYPRQCVFIGSTNNVDFLKDDTGNRRFWPIICGNRDVDINGLKQNLAQLWAEALHMYREMRAEYEYGTLPLYLESEESRKTADELQESSRRTSVTDILAERIQPVLDRKITHDDFENVSEGGVPAAKRREYVTCGMIVEEMGDGSVRPDMIPSALLKLGWEKTGARRRLAGASHARAVYEPGPAQRARWAAMDAEKADDDLI